MRERRDLWEQANYDKNTDKQNMEWKKYIYMCGEWFMFRNIYNIK
jgi:hypothetical protein